MQAAQAALGAEWRWGIFGHSAGAYTSVSQPGEFPLGRVAICPGKAEYAGADPFFLIASEADGCYRVMGGAGFTIEGALADADRANGVSTTRFASTEEAFALGARCVGPFSAGGASEGSWRERGASQKTMLRSSEPKRSAQVFRAPPHV